MIIFWNNIILELIIIYSFINWIEIFDLLKIILIINTILNYFEIILIILFIIYREYQSSKIIIVPSWNTDQGVRYVCEYKSVKNFEYEINIKFENILFSLIKYASKAYFEEK